MDGRVLSEATIEETQQALQPQTTTLEAHRDLAGKSWRQYLKITKLNNATYYDEGNAAVEGK